MQVLIHRSEPNRPHISSDTRDFKERETKQTEMRRFFLGAPPPVFSRMCLRLVAVWPVWRPVAALFAASVRGYLRIAAETRNPFFSETSSFFQKTRFSRKNNGLFWRYFSRFRFRFRKLPGRNRARPHILRYPQAYPQDSPGSRASHWRFRGDSRGESPANGVTRGRVGVNRPGTSDSRP